MKDIYLVTGAGGFLGGHLVKFLCEQGVCVRAMIRSQKGIDSLNELGAEVVEADLKDQDSLEKAVQGVKGIYHIASLFRQAGLPESVFYDVNVEGTRRLFDAAIKAGVERIIHCSTVGVLGHVENPPGNEESPPNPGDMYQRSKWEGEKVAMDYFKKEKIRGVIIRPSMIYGPGDTRTLKLFKMIAKKSFFYVGKGNALVHWVDVRDLSRSFYLAMNKTDLNAEVYIIAGETSLTLKEMVKKVADFLKVKPPWLHIPVKPMQWMGSICEWICTPFKIQPPIFRRRVDFFTKDRHFDISKAQRDLGFNPKSTFDNELRDIINYYQKNELI